MKKVHRIRLYCRALLAGRDGKRRERIKVWSYFNPQWSREFIEQCDDSKITQSNNVGEGFPGIFSFSHRQATWIGNEKDHISGQSHGEASNVSRMSLMSCGGNIAAPDLGLALDLSIFIRTKARPNSKATNWLTRRSRSNLWSFYKQRRQIILGGWGAGEPHKANW